MIKLLYFFILHERKILCLVSTSILITNGSVYWEVKTNPIIFGKDVYLFCHLPRNFSMDSSRQWKSGSSLLSFDEGPIDVNKYAGILDTDGFTLIIKYFAVEDFRRSYTCSYGFDKYTQILTTENYRWIPESDTYNATVNWISDHVEVAILFRKIYPQPECFIMFGDNIKNSTLNTTQQIVDSYFLTVDMVLLYKYDLLDCGEHLIAFCDIEKKSEQIQSFESPRYCSDMCIRGERCASNGSCAVGSDKVICFCKNDVHREWCRENAMSTTVIAQTTESNKESLDTFPYVTIGLFIGICGAVAFITALLYKCKSRCQKEVKRIHSLSKDSEPESTVMITISRNV